MILRIDEPVMESMESLAVNYSMEQLNFEVVKEMMIANHRMSMNPGVNSIITESTSSIFDKMATYFKELIKKIKEFFSKVMMYINAYLQDLDKFCAQYKDKLNNLSPKFTFLGYEYTIDSKLPVMDEFEKIVNDYNSSLSDIKEMKLQDVKKEHLDYLSGSNLNKLRGSVLGKSSPIQEDDFNSEVLKTFRNGSEDTVEIDIDSSYIKNIVSGAKSLVDQKNKCERDKQALINLLNKTENFFDKKVEVVYKDLTDKEIRQSTISTSDNKFSKGDDVAINYTENVSKVLAAVIKFKYDQVKNISGMINTVMIERVNAYKSNIKQNSQILRQALFHKEEGGSN